MSFFASVGPPSLPTMVLKRSGRRVQFDARRIERALALCYMDIEKFPGSGSFNHLSETIFARLRIYYGQTVEVHVEQLQDLICATLLELGEQEAAEHYLDYRRAHRAARESRPIDDATRDAFAQSAQYLATPLQQFQYYDKYARWNDAAGRRETWQETIARAVAFLKELVSDHTGTLCEDAIPWATIEQAMLDMRVMPSMRLLAMAGPAARRNHIALYNCAYLPVDDPAAFGEALLISMSGCGVGYSVERAYVEGFARVTRQTGTIHTHIVADSTEGWKQALDLGVAQWMRGHDVRFDLRRVRPAGSPLKTKGGRASGPEALRQMLDAVRAIILSRQGGFLHPLDCHDIMCHVGQAAVSGGTRRTAMLSLFDWDDQEMLTCKDPEALGLNTQRWNANNSAVWPERGVTQVELLQQMTRMAAARSGEPGIFSRQAALSLRPARRAAAAFGVNPCGEIVLRPFEFCNLSMAVARAQDTEADLREKVVLAAMIGTIQSLATSFKGLRAAWQENCEEERLLGVDITGQRDCALFTSPDPLFLASLRALVNETNTVLAARLKINPAAATTCVKPSGNSSQLLDCASGLHARFAPHYLRRVRVDVHSPVYKLLRDEGVPLVPENGQKEEDATTWVATFPVSAPAQAVVQSHLSAVAQCEHWLLNKLYWTEHNPSVTITYRPYELIALCAWLWEHRDVVGGMAFLPASDARYDLMPYEEISATTAANWHATFPTVRYEKLMRYEHSDETTAAQELACSAGRCDL